MNFVFYDLETTGISPEFDQPLQFAAIWTDEAFVEKARINIRCRLAPHILPSPQALVVTRVAPDHLIDPNLPSLLDFAQQVAEFVGRLRSQPFANAFQRAPGIAESVEWAKALVALDTIVVDPEVVSDTAGILFKQREDVAALTRDMAAQLLQPAEADA